MFMGFEAEDLNLLCFEVQRDPPVSATRSLFSEMDPMCTSAADCGGAFVNGPSIPVPGQIQRQRLKN